MVRVRTWVGCTNLNKIHAAQQLVSSIVGDSRFPRRIWQEIGELQRLIFEGEVRKIRKRATVSEMCIKNKFQHSSLSRKSFSEVRSALHSSLIQKQKRSENCLKIHSNLTCSTS